MKLHATKFFLIFFVPCFYLTIGQQLRRTPILQNFLQHLLESLDILKYSV